MNINRINSDKNTIQNVSLIELEINGNRITLTDESGELRVCGHSTGIVVKPSGPNEILVRTER